jgi:hypothetical protein
MPQILTFEQALDASSKAKHRHLLLGNGFSIACRPDIFVYKKLFEQANFNEIPRARKAFDALGTTDFERMIKALRDFAAIAPIYGHHSAEAEADAVALREVLVRTIAGSHPARPGDIAPDEYAHCKSFLSHFDRIFTLNYDLLLYWALMQDEIQPAVSCDDGFRKSDDKDAGYVTWEPENIYGQNIYYLHGALHLFDAQTELQKYTWTNTGVPLIDQIRDALSRNFFPLFVAEGTSEEKIIRIRHSDYLSKAYRSFIPITGPLFVYGHSLADNDDHILQVIGWGKTDSLFVSIHNDPESEKNQEIIRRATALAGHRSPRNPLAVYFFHAESASIWR